MLIQGASTVASETTPQIASKIASKVASKIAWRLVPLLMLCYFVAFLDRVNVSFAALTMMRVIQVRAPKRASARLLGTSKTK